MVFSSAIFLFAFLPLFLTSYYLVPARYRSLLILIASYAFYGWWKFGYLLVVVGISLISYVAAWLSLACHETKHRKWAVWAGVSLDLAVLAYFKYTYFVIENLAPAFAAFGGYSSPAMQIILPIGISFLTFQSISYIIDVAREDAPPARNLVDFLAFTALFPQLIAGPVLRYKDLSAQFSNRRHSIEKFSSGLHRFVTGLAMKLLVADSIAPLADRMFALSHPTLTEAWLGALAYSMQLFFDFAGYSAMAVGLGLMIGFRFVENFNAPYVSQSITEFWRRWHISLSNWLRDYLYVPLGGNRKGTLKTYRNLLITMVLGGLWHGANWTFVLWGSWHGFFLAIERWRTRRIQGEVMRIWPRYIGWPFTTLVVLLGWVMFRAPSVSDAIGMYVGMIGLNGIALSAETVHFNQPLEFIMLLVSILLVCIPKAKFVVWGNAPTFASFVLFGLCTVVLMARTYSPFLYFQF
ncbi:MBOAT family O-acyltransferase [Cochlodiniinecator piscidefendens]|uniref:MBOAT family O-acyltransferase n=1 Tax=Cochlodiniinecator piscidefendens TaxID=2715756 RepID=UPI00140B9DCA|nr:MBOAT family protein [Cochlodiniinecator piscidefendens]